VLLASLVSIVAPVVGVGDQAAVRQCRGDGQCTGRELLFHLEHITASDTIQRRWSVPRSEGSERS
jgi:hypothetical protein